MSDPATLIERIGGQALRFGYRILWLISAALLITVNCSHVNAEGTIAWVGGLGCQAWGLAVVGDLAYVGEIPYLTILDVSDSALPEQISKLEVGTIASICVEGNLAYLALAPGGFVIVDI